MTTHWPRYAARQAAILCWFKLKMLSRSRFFVVATIVEPVVIANIAFLTIRAADNGATLLYFAVGSGVMGMWTSLLWGAATLIQFERYQGTLELLVMAPVPLFRVLLVQTLAAAVWGLYSMGATLAWAVLFYDMPLRFSSPSLMVLALVATTVSLAFFGQFLASTFILYRAANALSNLLSYPVWLVAGLLVPLSLLPHWTVPVNLILPPAWGGRAIRAAALGGDVGSSIAALFLLAAAYLVLARIAFQYFERLARERATLSLRQI